MSRNNEMAKYGAVSEIVGPVDRVVVVGAGIAGLAAASRLRRAGIACVVLEARDRIGGRLHTVDLSGVPVDLGGSWIHHPIGNPISALCDESASRATPATPHRRCRRTTGPSADTSTTPKPRSTREQESDAFWDAVDALSDRLGPDATGLDAIEAYVAERGFTGAVARRVRQALRAEVEADAGDRADNNSLRWMTYGEEFEGPGARRVAPRRLPVGGRGAGERTRRPVQHRSRLGGGRDRRHSGEMRGRFGRNRLACRSSPCPSACSSGAAPRFDPPLPAPVQRAVDALGFGRYEKIALRFESAFWRDDGISHLIVFPSDDAEPAMWVFDLDGFGAGPVLCAHLFHTLTPHALDRAHEQAVDWLRDVLADVYGHPVPDPIAAAVTSWASDPFTGGAYSHCPPGADPSMLDLLGEPMHGRLLLAGEHTQSARYGYADGAYVSGLRAADRLA